ncbi:dTTP/UTP pyrophosphatase isoform X3 [Bacillus rossius redtenbacheri]|uniref:dTTP/UTP pyrophosphatase isoform X3 n=1 Tax=Bacillus rossius redtenbacheri TaxID=93214 RepID=UPI002FDED440
MENIWEKNVFSKKFRLKIILRLYIYFKIFVAAIFAMLEPIKHILKSQKIVLASSSPRRKEILSSVGLPFEVCVSRYEEDLDPGNYKCPGDFVVATATNKVQEVLGRLRAEESGQPDLVIGADTIVALGGDVLGKPGSSQRAVEMLQRLSGRPHTVYTGVVLHTRSQCVTFFESTEVYVDKLSSEMIKAYVDTGEPLDKAGAYGIQGLGGSLIEKIEGDYYNVMGLPLHAVCKHIVKLYRDKLL